MENDIKVKIKAAVPVKYKDFEVLVRQNDKKLGTMLISKGNIEWVPSGNSINRRRMSWSQFAEVMAEQGRPIKKPKK